MKPYEDLVADRLGGAVRLGQERVDWPWAVTEALRLRASKSRGRSSNCGSLARGGYATAVQIVHASDALVRCLDDTIFAKSRSGRATLSATTAAFDHLALRDLVDLLSNEEQQDLRPVVLRLVTSHAQTADPSPADEPSTPKHHLSFAATVHAGPEFATTSQDVLSRELGGHG